MFKCFADNVNDNQTDKIGIIKLVRAQNFLKTNTSYPLIRIFYPS